LLFAGELQLEAEIEEPSMEDLTRLVSESLARHGFDRPVDYRRLQWSRWFRCESLHSLLSVPSKPGIFALAEEVMEFGPGNTHGETAAAAGEKRRVLSVVQFREADDMAFVLDRMHSRENPMSARLSSGTCFIRFVVLEDTVQRRNICGSLNQWLLSTAEKATGIGAHFASSLEVVARPPLRANANAATREAEEVKEVKTNARQTAALGTNAPIDSGSAANIHCSQPLPSGF
jgi:hypothetical protein